jgi:hypothetical protein
MQHVNGVVQTLREELDCPLTRAVTGVEALDGMCLDGIGNA